MLGAKVPTSFEVIVDSHAIITEERGSWPFRYEKFWISYCTAWWPITYDN